MKPIKLLIALCIVTGLSGPILNAQMVQDKGSVRWEFTGAWIDECVGETLTGYIDYDYYTIWKEDPGTWFKWQDRFRGMFIGDVTGAVYYYIETSQHRHISNPNTFTFTDNFHYNIIRQGDGVIGSGHLLFHFTWNMTLMDFTSYFEKTW